MIHRSGVSWWWLLLSSAFAAVLAAVAVLRLSATTTMFLFPYSAVASLLYVFRTVLFALAFTRFGHGFNALVHGANSTIGLLKLHHGV